MRMKRSMSSDGMYWVLRTLSNTIHDIRDTILRKKEGGTWIEVCNALAEATTAIAKALDALPSR